jgi:sterol desaturase/sphingolipid hydroxylase (fatty acid hydroxylase superfamily)
VTRRGINAAALLYPALTIAGAWAMAIALDHELPALATLIAIQTVGTLALAGLEYVLPHRRGWLHSHGDVTTDLGHLLITTNLITGINWLVSVVFVAIAGEGPVGFAIWPSAWPLPAQLVLLTVIQSLTGYWVHRAQHEIPLLWRVHAIQHSAPRVYWLNQWRGHPLEGLVNSVSIVPVALMGAPEATLLVFTAFNSIHLVMQHANIEIRLGRLNRVLSMCETHRWHHSREIHESNANYGGLLLVWDVLFRTWWFPDDRVGPTDAGLPAGSQFPAGYLGQLVAPFRQSLWRRP